MKRSSAFVAAIAAMALIAATGTDGKAVGTATTQITGAEVTLSGLVDVPTVTVLDITSFASTDSDTKHNPAGTPFAAIAATPAAIGDQSFGETTVSSDDDGTASTTGVDESVGPLTAAVNTIDLTAAAGSDFASAVVDGVVADVAAFGGAIGLSLEDAGANADVTSRDATAFQGITLTGLGVDLGDLLPAEDLPLEVVLDLVDALAGNIGGALGDLVDEVLAAREAYESALTSLRAAAAHYDATANDLEGLLAQLAAANEQLGELEDELAEAIDLLNSSSPTQDAVDDLVDRVGDTIGALQTDGVTDQLNGLVAELEDAIADLQDTIAGIEADIAVLSAELEAILDTLSGLVGQLDGLLADLLAALQDLLDQLPDVLAAIEAMDIAGVDDIIAGLSAYAGATNAEANLECTVSGVQLAGLDVTPTDCLTPLTQTSALVEAGVTTIEDVLGALPVAGGVVPDVSFSMFSDAREDTGTADGYNTALTHVTLLDLEVPPVELGAVADGLLDGLADADLSALLSDVQATLEQDVGGPIGQLGGDLVGTLNDTVGEVTDAVGGVADVEGIISDLLDTLPAPDALEGLSTLGVHVVVDPTVTAQFKASPDGSDTSGAPSTRSGRTLPATGGGVAVLALLSIGGALALFRRRGPDARD